MKQILYANTRLYQGAFEVEKISLPPTAVFFVFDEEYIHHTNHSFLHAKP